MFTNILIFYYFFFNFLLALPAYKIQSFFFYFSCKSRITRSWRVSKIHPCKNCQIFFFGIVFTNFVNPYICTYFILSFDSLFIFFFIVIYFIFSIYIYFFLCLISFCLITRYSCLLDRTQTAHPYNWLRINKTAMSYNKSSSLQLPGINPLLPSHIPHGANAPRGLSDMLSMCIYLLFVVNVIHTHLYVDLYAWQKLEPVSVLNK